ncbi:MAG: hypothetical protein ACR2QF_06960 [Geminicoccaceae bacterium]
MAKRISELPVAPSVADSDQLEANQAGTSRSVTRGQLVASRLPLIPNFIQLADIGGNGQFWFLQEEADNSRTWRYGATQAGGIQATLSVSGTFTAQGELIGLTPPSSTTREPYQINLPKVVVDTNTTLSRALHHKRLIDIDNDLAAITLTLPDPTDAQFSDLEPGHFCDVRVRSGSFPASIDVAVTDTFRHQNGYAALTTGLEDAIFLGYRLTSQIGVVNQIYREDDRWLFKGQFRIVETDDLTLDLAIESDGVQVLSHSNRLNFNDQFLVETLGRTATIGLGITTPVDINGRTLVDADHNRQFRCTGTNTVTVPAALTDGATVLLMNRAGGAVPIVGSGVTITGDTSLSDRHFATVVKDAAGTAIVRATG